MAELDTCCRRMTALVMFSATLVTARVAPPTTPRVTAVPPSDPINAPPKALRIGRRVAIPTERKKIRIFVISRGARSATSQLTRGGIPVQTMRIIYHTPQCKPFLQKTPTSRRLMIFKFMLEDLCSQVDIRPHAISLCSK
jgi:hypothetical protein